MTVKELIDVLNKFPSNAKVVISDADTEWDLQVHVSLGTTNLYGREKDPDTVYIWGDYSEIDESGAPA